MTLAVERAFADGSLVPAEEGGAAGTTQIEIEDAVRQQLERTAHATDG